MYRNLTTTWKDEIIKSSLLAQGDRAKVEFLFPMRGLVGWQSRFQRLGHLRPPYRLRQAAALERHAPGVFAPRHLVHGPPRSARPQRRRRLLARRPRHHRRPQPAHRLGHHQSPLRRAGSLHREDRRPHRSLPLPRSGGAGARRARDHSRQGPPPTSKCPPGLRATAPSSSPRATSVSPSAGPPPNAACCSSPSSISIARRTGNSSRPLSNDSPDPAPTSSTPTSMATSAITPSARCPGATTIAATYRSMAPPETSSGMATFPFEQLPSVYNPPGGMIVTANQNPFPENFPYPVNGNFAPPHALRPDSRPALRAREGWSPPEMLDVQKDVYSAFSHFLARQIVDAYQRRNAHNPAVEDSVAMLREWNGQMDKDLRRAVSHHPRLSARAPRHRGERLLRHRHRVRIQPRSRRRPTPPHRTPDRLVRRLRRHAAARPRRCRRGSPPHSGPRAQALALRPVPAHRHQQPRDSPGPRLSATTSISAPCP